MAVPIAWVARDVILTSRLERLQRRHPFELCHGCARVGLKGGSGASGTEAFEAVYSRSKIARIDDQVAVAAVSKAAGHHLRIYGFWIHCLSVPVMGAGEHCSRID